MAHTKAGGSTKLGRDSASKRLGVKLFGGQAVKAGDILVRQRGTRIEPGVGTSLGKDQTIFAIRPGTATYTTKKIVKFTGQRIRRTIVNVD